MIDSESALNLEQDEPEVAVFLEENGGRLDPDDEDGSVFWLTMRPQSQPQERYYARLQWDSYPYKPPSIKFADAIGGSLTVTRAWPRITGYRPGSFDVCRPISREGFALHSEWNQGATAWPVEGNPFLWVAQTMQFHMDNEYDGRAE